MKIKLFDSELKVMELLWEHGELSAKEIAEKTAEQIGWSKTTTYTVLKKCIEKGAIERIEPNFLCRALISRREAQEFETEELINKMYGGAADGLIASLLSNRVLSKEEIAHLKHLVNELK
ncbi:MAG: BlaI/MecI/CopY family transcriptional regulator [Firmicutes bacterium]|nr:BlaI/MecI/CopY family transcriptional regulator [Bacillota bacterium]